MYVLVAIGVVVIYDYAESEGSILKLDKFLAYNFCGSFENHKSTILKIFRLYGSYCMLIRIQSQI